MILVTCRHCSTNIEINSKTRASLKKSLQFQCPVCSGYLPTSLLKKGKVVPDSDDAGKATWFGVKRNLLILGAAALLLLGVLGIHLVTRPSSKELDLAQDIRQVTVRNQYFADLLARGDAEEEALGKISRISEFGPTFIGLTDQPLTWQAAHDLAARAGGKVLTVESASERTAPWNDPSTARLISYLRSAFPEASGHTTWISQDSSPIPRVIDSPDVSRVTTPDRPRRAFIRWFP